jgi:hypothetical protein
MFKQTEPIFSASQPIEKRAASHSFDPNFKVKLQLPWQWHALARGLKDHYLTQLGYPNGIIGTAMYSLS